MGVHGLTSFLAQYPSASQTITLTPPPAGTPPTAFIVDLLAFTYAISMHDEARGEQYELIKSILRLNVEYWRACGLGPEFVVDGESGMLHLGRSRTGGLTTLLSCPFSIKARPRRPS